MTKASPVFPTYFYSAGTKGLGVPPPSLSVLPLIAIQGPTLPIPKPKTKTSLTNVINPSHPMPSRWL